MLLRVNSAIANGLMYITNQEIAGVDTRHKTVTAAALMLSALTAVKQESAYTVRERLVSFLLLHKNQYWVFSDTLTTPNEPPNLDTTFCALIGLYLHDPTIITTDVLAYATKLLIAAETQVGGPYKTSLNPSQIDEEPSIDTAVNANIAYFLSAISNPLPNVTDTMEKAIISGQFTSQRYYSPFIPIYFMARAYQGPLKDRLIAHVQNLHTTHTLSGLEHGLVAISLLRLGVAAKDVQPHIDSLLALQHDNGSWEAASLHKGGRKSPYDTTDSPSLTTAFALEALALYEQSLAKPVATPVKTPSLHIDPEFRQQVSAKVRQDCEKISHPLHTYLMDYVENFITNTHSPEIIGLAYLFSQTLKQPLADTDELLCQLGALNVYSWAAYTIYDDFIDEEGEPLQLSIANVVMRMAYSQYLILTASNPELENIVSQTFNTIDTANAWEVANCRFEVYGNTITLQRLPDYGDLGQLANRSLAHALGPLVVLVKNGYATTSKDFQVIFTALKHYIIAKQLNDDMHDWQEDFQRGHITYVVRTILSELHFQNGAYTFADLQPVMQKHFWYHTLNTICDEMQHQLELSRNALAETTSLESDTVIDKLLNNIDSSIQVTRAKQTQTIQFLTYFK